MRWNVSQMAENERNLVAPCGMNCGVCTAYLAYARNIPKQRGVIHCSGCRVRNKTCAFIKKACPQKIGKNLSYCFECTQFPCERLNKLDARYRRDYNMSMVKNLTLMKEHGIEAFLKAQHEEYGCKKCGGMTSVHNGFCYDCGKDELLAQVNTKHTTVRKQKSSK